MKKLQIVALLLFIIFPLSLFAQNKVQPTLKLMDKAPALKILKWLKGQPVTKLSNDRIYLMEFSSVGCAPCRSAIPHMSAVATKYQDKVTFISVYVLENSARDSVSTDYADRVEKFILKVNDKISYRVALDDPRQTMNRTWLLDAGYNGVPIAMIVKKGVIVWMGGVMDIDLALESVVEKQKAEQATALKSPDQDGMRIYNLKKQGDLKTALRLTDSLIALYPENHWRYDDRLKIAMELNEDDGYRYGYKLLENQCKDDEAMLFYLAAAILIEAANSKISHPDWNLALAFCERARQINKFDAVTAQILDLESQIYWKINDYTKALALEESAFELVKDYSENDPRAMEGKNAYSRRLEYYRAKLK